MPVFCRLLTGNNRRPRPICFPDYQEAHLLFSCCYRSIYQEEVADANRRGPAAFAGLPVEHIENFLIASSQLPCKLSLANDTSRPHIVVVEIGGGTL